VSIPGGISPSAKFQLSAEEKKERKIDIFGPQKLIDFLAGKIIFGRLRGAGIKPPGSVRECGNQCEARPA